MPIPTCLLIRVARLAPLLSADTRNRLERRIRGRREARQLARADFAVISAAKSGRTWLRLMLTRYLQNIFDLPEGLLLTGDNLRRLHRQAPAVVFTHDNLIRDHLGSPAATAAFRRKGVVFLIRHPADAAVSGYFHWRHRMTPAKRALKGYPPTSAEPSIYDFVMREPGNLKRIIAFINRWAAELREHPNFIFVRYEDLRAQPQAELDRVVRFMQFTPSDKAVQDAVAYASLDKMRELERAGTFASSGRALRPVDGRQISALKARRGVVHGYRDYFAAEELAEIEAHIARTLDPMFRYCQPGARPAA